MMMDHLGGVIGAATGAGCSGRIIINEDGERMNRQHSLVLFDFLTGSADISRVNGGPIEQYMRWQGMLNKIKSYNMARKKIL
jgi:hypothetical protein